MLRSIWSTNNLAWIKLARRTLSTVVENVSKSDTTAKTTKSIVVEAKKTNLPQSPLKMKFLVSLIRGAWVPDALAQLKFSPKRRADDVAKILKVLLVLVVLIQL